MSDRDLYLSSGPSLPYFLSALLFCAGLVGWCVLWIQAGQALLTVLRRGREYRARMRAARHARRLVTR